jgi:hypothetical protein
VIISACDKKDTVTFSANGNAPVLSSSVSQIAAAAKDSLATGLILKWTNPMYSTDFKTTMYTVEIDSSGRNFAKSVKLTVVGSLTDTFTNGALNSILLGFGFNYKVAYNVDIRVTSSYGNNNEQYVSNTLTLNMTPYVTPPLVAPPSVLYMVGAATQNGWNVNYPDSTQKFYQRDSVTFEGVFNLNGGQQFLLMPVYGSWDYKYAVIDNTTGTIAAGTGGSFGYYTSATPTAYNSNIPAPATSGWYDVVVDFQHGLYTITPYTSTFPTNLYIVGDATADSWNNSNPPVNPVFKQLNAAQFQVTMPLIGGKSFLMLPVAGSWTNKYAVANSSVPSSGGSFGYNLSTNFNAPATSGTYTITANFFDFTFTVK